MREAVNRVKTVLAAREVAPYLTHYLVKDGMLWASDGRAVAATPVDQDGHFLVPGAELGAVLDRMPEDYKVTLEPGALKVRGGRRHGTLPIIAEPEVAYPEPDQGLWTEYTPALHAALWIIRPFISDNAIHDWTLCACLAPDRVTATNNIVVAQAECPGLNAQGLIPFWVIDFVHGQHSAPVSWYITDNHVAFKWADGTWFRSQLVNGIFNETALELVDAVEAPAWEIPEEWRQAYEYVSSLSEDAVVIEAGRLVGGRGKAAVEHETPDTPVPDGGSSSWNPKFLTKVIEAATHWDPGAWPKPTPWTGPGIKGLIVGRNR